MLKYMRTIRSGILLFGMLLIAVINVGPHLPFADFKEINIRMPETKETAGVFVAHDKNDTYAIPVLDSKDGKRVETGLFVDVNINELSERFEPQPGRDQTSKPTLRITGYVLGLYLLTFPISWIVRLSHKWRTARAT